jgi:hypothetical protein
MVAVGKTASLELVIGNPLEDIRDASQIAGVFLRGRFYSSEDSNSVLANMNQLDV